MKRLIITCLIILLILFLTKNDLKAAEDYPVKPIYMIAFVEAGADADIAIRPVVKKASEILGQPIVIVNKQKAAFRRGKPPIVQTKLI